MLDGEPSPKERIGARRKEAVRLLSLSAISRDSYQAFWDQLGIPYFLRTDASDIAWHTRVFARHAASTTPRVQSRLSPFGVGFQVAVYLPDQEDLFARLCGYFDSSGLSVLDARVHTTAAGYALDSFLVIDPFQSVSYRDRLGLVETGLQERLAAKAPLPPLVDARSSRRSRSFPIKPQVEIKPYEKADSFLLSILATIGPACSTGLRWCWPSTGSR
ncbi:MAG: hypothetical protein R3E68_17535 [Burkholderiaceae bacterium]